MTKTLRTPVNFIVHTLQEVNDALAHGRYFFMHIASAGVVLYQSDDSGLHEPKPTTPDHALATAKEYFHELLPCGAEFFANFKFNLEPGHPHNAAFKPHQAVE